MGPLKTCSASSGGALRAFFVSAAAILAAAVAASSPAGASTELTLDGSYNTVIVKPQYVPLCPHGIECGSIELIGLGTADWVYVFGPTFDPIGRCFNVDGTITFTLRSDASAISGPLTGVFCPGPSGTAQEHSGTISYGNPFHEDDVITFTTGTGQFAGLTGSAAFHTFFAGARSRTTLAGTLH